ncbi:hypothetical protein C4D60_Mb08t07150 [Musa balbisiana]|uniref:Uncharacterized protein n=1 Tax=Musa balbisiana TaxID=52838 RepID=A0A4S8K1Y4_MUSBA|nr:hypothetical protein C4D60_Mb08t07150 [Musa balbisiana]
MNACWQQMSHHFSKHTSSPSDCQVKREKTRTTDDFDATIKAERLTFLVFLRRRVRWLIACMFVRKYDDEVSWGREDGSKEQDIISES